MFGKFTSPAFAVAALLSLCSFACADSSTDITSVLICTSNIYADGFIYQNTTGDGTTSTSLEDFPTTVTFPLYLAVTSHSNGPLNPIQPAQVTATHDYQALDKNLYINVSTDAFAPVGFVTGGNRTLGAGETTWGFYEAYGFFMWYNLPPASSTGSSSLTSSLPSTPVHIQGFQWVPVEGYADLTQLYWNQTQYDLAAAQGSHSGIKAASASFGICSSDSEAKVAAA